MTNLLFKFVEDFKELRLLSITGNKNINFTGIRFPKNLYSLSLIGNCLTSEDLLNIEFPPKLKVINLANNKILHINFKLPKKLKWLDISSNKINSLNNVVFPKSLRMLSLNTNLLTDDSLEGINVPKKLKLLDISGNIISSEKSLFICNKFNIIVKCYCINQRGPIIYFRPGKEYNINRYLDNMFHYNTEYITIDVQ